MQGPLPLIRDSIFSHCLGPLYQIPITMSSLFLLYLLFFHTFPWAPPLLTLKWCGSPLNVSVTTVYRIPACHVDLFVQLRYQLCSLLLFQFSQFSSSRMAFLIAFFSSLTRCRAASSRFSLFLRDGFLKYLRSLSSLYIPSLITRFFSFCIARFGSSPRLTFIVIVMLFSATVLLQYVCH